MTRGHQVGYDALLDWRETQREFWVDATIPNKSEALSVIRQLQILRQRKAKERRVSGGETQR